MKVAVIGAGAIGNLIAGYLALKSNDVYLVGNKDSVTAITLSGLRITGARGDFSVKIDIVPFLKSRTDIIVLTTKTQDLEIALQANQKFLSGATVVTTQNGVHADEIVARYIPRENIVSSIVMFGATYLEPGKVVHNFEGNWIFGKIFESNDVRLNEVRTLFSSIFPTVIADDIRGMKYLKIFVNANNCIPAILGLSMQESFADIETSRISIAIWKEGMEVIKKAGIHLESLPDFPLERLTKLTSLPVDEAAKIFSGIMMHLSKEPLYGSILQSIKRGRESEIDYINGEFVTQAQLAGSQAALNQRLIEMVHQVEKTKKFFTREAFLAETKGYVN